MKTYIFEIQNCIKIKITGESKEDARRELVENPDLYQAEMCGGSCYISDGEEDK